MPLRRHGAPDAEPKGDWKAKFLAAMAKHGIVAAACKTAGIGRTHVYRVYHSDSEFREAWDTAYETSTDALEMEAHRRGAKGVRKAKWHQGKKVGFERVYSDALLLATLRRRRPEAWREHFDLEKLARILLEAQASNGKLGESQDSTTTTEEPE